LGALPLEPGALPLEPGALALEPCALALEPGALALEPGALALEPGALALPVGCGACVAVPDGGAAALGLVSVSRSRAACSRVLSSCAKAWRSPSRWR
jgi:sirohydrochlorin cobaltochelatase